MPSNRKQSAWHSHSSQGFALIEALIAMVILAIALKGIGDYWMKTVKESEHNFSRSQALIVAQNIIEFIRVNPDGWAVYQDTANWASSNTAQAPTCFSTSSRTLTTCTPEQMARSDIALMKDYIKNHLPLLNGSLALRSPCHPGAKIACVIVAWMDTTTDQCNPFKDGAGFFEHPDDASDNSQAEQNQCVIIDFIPEHATANPS